MMILPSLLWLALYYYYWPLLKQQQFISSMQKKQHPRKFNKPLKKPFQPKTKRENNRPVKQEQRFNKNKPIKQEKQDDQKFNKHKPTKQGKQELPTIQVMLSIPEAERPVQSLVYFKKIRPFLSSYMQKKEGSRVIQLLYKWGTPEIKSQVHKVILENWKDLIKSKYALHTISKASNDFQLPRLVEDCIILQNNKQGSMLLQNFIDKHPNSKEAEAIYHKFTDIKQQQGEKGFESQQVLHNLAMKSLQKQYYQNSISKHIIRLAFPTMVQEQKTKCIEFLVEHFLELLDSEEGVKLFIELYNNLDSKQKKGVIKSIKGNINNIINQSRMSYVAIIKILTETDDTVMIGNKVISELLYPLSDECKQDQQVQQLESQDNDDNQMADEAEKKAKAKNEQNSMKDQNKPQSNVNKTEDHSSYNKKLLNIFCSILSPRANNFNCLGKLEHNVTFTTCKKPQQTRKQEIRQYLYPSLIEYVTNEENIHNFCTKPHESRVMLGLVKSMQSDADSEGLKSFTTKVIEYFIADLKSQKQENSKKIAVSKSLAADNFGSKLLKNILFLNESYIDKYCDKLSQIFKDNLQDTLHCNASFVLTALIEKGRSELIEEIKKTKIDVSKARASDFYMQRLKANDKTGMQSNNKNTSKPKGNKFNR